MIPISNNAFNGSSVYDYVLCQNHQVKVHQIDTSENYIFYMYIINPVSDLVNNIGGIMCPIHHMAWPASWIYMAWGRQTTNVW